MTRFVPQTLPLLLYYVLLWNPAASFITPELRRFRHLQLRAESYTVTVHYEGTSCDIQVRKSETILDALERTGAADTLALPEMPSDCRRGNCMTCSARFKNHQHSLVVRSDDGLSPEVSQQLNKSGYLLICSSYVQGDGLTLELGQNHGLWDIVYRKRFESESARLAARAALARLLRRNAENNIEQWTVEMEAVLEKSGRIEDISI